MTGLYPFNHGLRDLMHLKINKNKETIGEVFKKNGYNTYAAVTGSLFPAHGFSRGFDEYEQRELWDNLHSQWYNKLLKMFKSGYFEEPYFFFLHIWDLHQPRFVEKDLDNASFGKTLYERSVSSIDKKLGELFKLTNDDVTIVTGDHGEKISSNLMEDMMDRFKRLYYPHVRWKRKRFHRKISKMFRFALNIMQNTDSDFGATHGYHLYRPLITTPLIIKGLGPKGEENSLVRHIDILPSLRYELFGQKGDYDGVPIFKNDSLPNEAYSEIFLDNELKEEKWLISLMKNGYQYIFKPRGDHEKLYHKEKGEINDKKIELEMRKRVEEINPEVIEGYKLDNRVDMEREIIENKLRSVGYLD